MRQIRVVELNNRKVPVLLSDEKEALLAARAAGGAVVGLWDQNHPDRDLSPAVYVVERPEDADRRFLERVARRHLGLPWHICETKRLLIREICGDDFWELRDNHVGLGFSSADEMELYVKHQYAFYEFGFWAVVERESGSLLGIAGLTVMQEDDGAERLIRRIKSEPGGEAFAVMLELGYEIFVPHRRRGFAREACLAILDYARDELEADYACVRIDPKNEISRKFAKSLGFS